MFKNFEYEEPYLECVHCGECYALGYSYCVRDEGDEI